MVPLGLRPFFFPELHRQPTYPTPQNKNCRVSVEIGLRCVWSTQIHPEDNNTSKQDHVLLDKKNGLQEVGQVSTFRAPYLARAPNEIFTWKLVSRCEISCPFRIRIFSEHKLQGITWQVATHWETMFIRHQCLVIHRRQLSWYFGVNVVIFYQWYFVNSGFICFDFDFIWKYAYSL